MASYTTTDPTTGAVLATYETMRPVGIDAALSRSAGAYRTWTGARVSFRSRILRRIADLHRERAKDLARIVASEMGKPIEQGQAEVELAAAAYDYYAENAEVLLADEVLDTVIGGRAIVRTESIGPILGVMPWNFPFYQVARFVAPNLLLGNTILLKPARAVTATALAMDGIFRDSGAFVGVYETLLIAGGDVAEVIADDRVRGVSVTGSEEVGRSVAAVAGAHLKKCVLELGGSDAFIVLDDADVDTALDAAERGRFWNAGQVCNGAKRFIVQSGVWDEFVGGLVERAQAWLPGDPQSAETRLGPLASAEGRAEIHEQVLDAVRKGATLLAGGEPVEGAGSFYPMTVLTGVTPEMRAYGEELFGPVAVAYRVESDEEALRIANDSRFGLGGTVFSRDPERVEAIGGALETGMVGMNTFIRSQPALPFGGTKASGLGRELGRFGVDEFSNKKVLRYE